MFAALAEGHGNLKDKINLFIALAPVANLGWSPNKMLKSMSKFYKGV
jgi:hypothetical protein